jgi:hypothetical protein
MYSPCDPPQTKLQLLLLCADYLLSGDGGGDSVQSFTALRAAARKDGEDQAQNHDAAVGGASYSSLRPRPHLRHRGSAALHRQCSSTYG